MALREQRQRRRPENGRRRSAQTVRIPNRQLVIEHVPLSELYPNPRPARVHPQHKIESLARSIGKYEQAQPILVNGDNQIISGNARYEACKFLGRETIAVVHWEHLTETQQRAFAIYDNRIHEDSEWDTSVLAQEFDFLLEADLDLEIEETGFTTPEIDQILTLGSGAIADDSADQLPLVPATPISRLGDLWHMDRHRLVVGNALHHDTYESLMDGALATLCLSDLPYNVAMAGHAGGKGKIKHREFEMASGEMTDAEFDEFLQTAIEHAKANVTSSGVFQLFMDWRHVDQLIQAGKGLSLHLLNICVWDKINPGMGSFYRSQHELVCVFARSRAQYRNNVQLGRHGRNRSNVWSCPGITTPTTENRKLLALHPTVKPVGLIADAIRDCTKRGDLVLDSFAGSGTILLACERTGRHARAIEIDPIYADVAVARWQEMTGKSATLGETGETFEEVETRRKANKGDEDD